MKKKTTIVTIALLVFNFSCTQNQQKYSELVSEASKLYENGEYLKSGQKYSHAFTALENKAIVKDRYNAARAYSLANEVDSAFIQLFKISKKENYSDYKQIRTDPTLTSLHSDKRWDVVVENVKANKIALMATLDTILQDDQKYRGMINEIADTYGWQSEELKAHWKVINEKDSINLMKVERILDQHGWLSSDRVGIQGNVTLFLVIQHADLETQLKYLPVVRKAVEKGDAQAKHLALLEDRVAIRQGKKQIYGSQVRKDPETDEFYVLPLKDPEDVDKRRAEVGLGNLQSYVAQWGIIWNAKAYKKKLPEIEAKSSERTH